MVSGGPLLTFAIPVYNQSEAYVQIAIESVLAQSGLWSLVVVDDSRDNSTRYKSLVLRFRDERIRYVRNTDAHGIGNAWNRCLAEATTTFVTIVHADDQLRKDYSMRMLDLAERNPSGSLYFCFADIIDAAGRPTFSLPDLVKTALAPVTNEFVLAGEAGIVRLCIGDFIMCPTVMYRRSDLRSPAFSTVLRQVVDLDLYLDVLFAGREIVGTRRAAYRYRRHASSTTKTLTDDGARFLEEMTLYLRTAGRAAEHALHRAEFVARAMPLVRINLLLAAASDFFRGRFSAGRAKLRLLLARSEASLQPPQKSRA